MKKMMFPFWMALVGCSGGQIEPTDTAEPSTPDPPTPETCGFVEVAPEPIPADATCGPAAATGPLAVSVIDGRTDIPSGMGPAAIGDIDDDGIPEMVFHSWDLSGLVSYDGVTLEEDWRNPQVYRIDGGVAIGDLDGDGVPEIVTGQGNEGVNVVERDGTLRWRVPVDNSLVNDFVYPSIADLDGDGTAEIIAGRAILDPDGNVLGVGAYGTGGVRHRVFEEYSGSSSVAADLDGDGMLEVVVGNAAYRMDGSALYTNGEPDGCPAVADLDLDGQPEVIVSTAGKVAILDHTLTPTGWSDEFEGANYVGCAAVGDLDRDGVPEFVVLGPEEVRAYRGDGTRLWTAPAEDATGAAGPMLYDLDGDGFLEVLVADEHNVWFLAGTDGSVRYHSEDFWSGTALDTPAVVDIDGDGQVEVVVMQMYGDGGILIFESAGEPWASGRPVYNQHAFTGTNVNDDLTIPTDAGQWWLTHNSFRSGPLVELDTADARPEASVELLQFCPDACPTLFLQVRVRNAGASVVPAGTPGVVRAGPDGETLTTFTLPEAVPPATAGRSFVIEVPDVTFGGPPWVELDLGGEDCDPTNDGASLAAACPA